jgi:hypothetical protein
LEEGKGKEGGREIFIPGSGDMDSKNVVTSDQCISS